MNRIARKIKMGFNLFDIILKYYSVLFDKKFTGGFFKRFMCMQDFSDYYYGGPGY